MRQDDRKILALSHQRLLQPSIVSNMDSHTMVDKHQDSDLAYDHQLKFSKLDSVELGLPGSDSRFSSERAPRRLARHLLFLLIIFASLQWVFRPLTDRGEDFNFADDICPQVAPLSPSASASLLESLEGDYATDTFQSSAFELLGGAVRIPTEMYDDLKPPGQDERWEIFSVLHAYLEAKFPLVHLKLQKTTVNLYALVFHWQGTDASLKPLLLTAHQDVVPVERTTVDQWVNPPFSGYFDGEWIWGRGSCDDKPGLIGTLLAVESLLAKGFEPTRSVVLAYGIDEERSGVSGATAIRDYLLANYGENAFSMLVDEGGGYTDVDGFVFSTPAVAEKGMLNARVQVSAPGGHSSVPPEHTSIGILASMIVALEANPLPTRLSRNGTYFARLQCAAAHDPSTPKTFKDMIIRASTDDGALARLEAHLQKTDRVFGPNTGTTQAVDIINGGVKANALPELAYAIVNHRIAEASSVGELEAHMTDVLAPIGHKHNLTIDAFSSIDKTGKNETPYKSSGLLILADAYGTALEPAPITPTVGSRPWELLSGTILSTVASNIRSGPSFQGAAVAPALSLGNTDTKHYWKLTRHIFRYGHRAATDSYNGAHTVNEALKGEGFIEEVRFLTRLILNADESELLE